MEDPFPVSLAEVLEFIILYFLLTGYLACARCSASGMCLNVEPISVSNASDRPLRAPTTQRCSSCSGVGKVFT